MIKKVLHLIKILIFKIIDIIISKFIVIYKIILKIPLIKKNKHPMFGNNIKILIKDKIVIYVHKHIP